MLYKNCFNQYLIICISITASAYITSTIFHKNTNLFYIALKSKSNYAHTDLMMPGRLLEPYEQMDSNHIRRK